MKDQHNTNALITLIFQDLATLWTFAHTLTCRNFEVNERALSLNCSCLETEEQAAYHHYNALRAAEAETQTSDPIISPLNQQI